MTRPTGFSSIGDFTFDDAARLVPYLDALGIWDLTGAAVPSGQARRALDVADLLARFPVAVLERKE